MIKGKLKKVIILIAFSCIYLTFAGIVSGESENLSLDDKIPIDSDIITGRFSNGLRYYIRKNSKPENRAELRLVINAGSVLEDDNQQGLAHFTEHMAFNGTKNFEKQELVNYLELLGMRFGPDLNAYTSFDETVYMLQIPTDKPEIMEKAFLILEDWSHNVSFDSEEIDKERGVIIEEWRLGRGAEARVRDKHLPVLFTDSRYGERLPIGKKEILESFEYDTLRNFYKSWYRPDLQAVIAVGDFDVETIKKLLEKHFSEIPSNKRPERVSYQVPDTKGTLYSIVSDPELPESSVDIYFKLITKTEEIVKDYRQNIVEDLFTSMFNQRLDELTQIPDPPFINAYSATAKIVNTRKFHILGASVGENGIDRGLEAILTEARRIKLYGFTGTELERQKKEMLRGIEKAYEERDKTESIVYASEYIRNYTEDEPIPGIEYEYELINKYLPGINLEEINALTQQFIDDSNRVVLVTMPEKEGLKVPDENDLKEIFARVETENIAEYEDNYTDKPLFDENLVYKSHMNEKTIKELGVTELLFPNGVRVILKPTDFKNDEILFTSFSPGGHSLVSLDSLVAAKTAVNIINQSGLGDFNGIQLNKKLAGKILRVSPWIDDVHEGISGSSSPKDIETTLQLIYMYFTEIRKDPDAYESLKNRISAMIKNRSADPSSAFQDTMEVTLANYNPRVKPLTMETLDRMNLDSSINIYKNRFADASDFTFIFVGTFEPDSLKHLLGKYLANLPSTNRDESWRDNGIRPPKGKIRKEIFKGIEDKSNTSIIFTGPFDFNRTNRYEIQSLASAIRIKMREVLREDLGGTYGVGVGASYTQYPEELYTLNVGFGSEPERVDEMVKMTLDIIEDVRKNGIEETYIDKVKEMQIRERETSLKQNSFWLSNLNFYYSNGENPTEILEFEKYVKLLNPDRMKKAAQKYFDTSNYVIITLLPEN